MGVSVLISVVIPTEDRPTMLGRSVRSVREQMYGPIELIAFGTAYLYAIWVIRPW